MDNEFIPDMSYPTEEEIKVAQLLCCGRVCRECETPAAYAWRKRDVDMSFLLEKAIEEELTEKEKIIIENRWFGSMSFSQIAKETGVSPAAVAQTSERALRKLEKALKYVVFYQTDIANERVVPATVARARAVASARNMNPKDICARLKCLRIGTGLSIRAFCKASGMTEKRVAELEKGCLPDYDELVFLSGFFAVSTDYILKGEKDV